MLAAVAGAVVMVVVLVVVFPVLFLVGTGVIAAVFGSLLKSDSDASNRDGGSPNEYLQLSDAEASTNYPHHS